MTTATSNFVVVYHARDVAQAHLIQAALETADIDAHIENEFIQPIVGEVLSAWDTAPLVLVDESHVAAALEIIHPIDVINSTEPSDEITAETASCLACGKSMSASETKCALCGWTYDGEFA